MKNYPECEKVEKNREFFNNVLEFIDYSECMTEQKAYEHLYNIFDIDLKKLECERKEILEIERNKL